MDEMEKAIETVYGKFHEAHDALVALELLYRKGKVGPPQPAQPESSPRSEAEGVYEETSQKVTPKLNFLGKWKTRGGFTVSVDEFTYGRWIGYWEDPKDGEIVRFTWDDAGNYENDEWTLTEKFREAQPFANG